MAMGAPTAVRLEAKNTGNGAAPLPRHQTLSSPRPLSISKPSWIVRTESNVWKEKRKQPDPPCVVCLGSGRVDCHDCCGRARKVKKDVQKFFPFSNKTAYPLKASAKQNLNYSQIPYLRDPFSLVVNLNIMCRVGTNCVNLRMLPNGEWPKWCRTCRGSGLGYCSRCVGTGEYRYIMGFQFMKRETNYTQNSKNNEDNDFSRTKPAGDLLINDNQQGSDQFSS